MNTCHNITNTICIITTIFILASCSSKENKAIENGRILFNQVHTGNNNVIGCISCHSLKPNIKTVGPTLFKIGLRADKMIKGLNAKEYLKQSIINPDAFIVSGYSPAIMFSHYQSELSVVEVDNLVSYLQSLK